jgi:hypothetical protein
MLEFEIGCLVQQARRGASVVRLLKVLPLPLRTWPKCFYIDGNALFLLLHRSV